MRVEMVGCERTILAEIADPRCTRRCVAQTYAFALRSDERDWMDWAKVNRAIIARWSLAGLEWIKKNAWSGKCFKESP